VSRKLRVGVVGANLQGSWGAWAHLPALAGLDRVEAVAVATTSMTSASATAGQFGLPHAFDDPRRLAECPDVDIVAICVRVPAHLELVGLALDAGKHVYCEWPLGRDTAEAVLLAEAAKRAGVVNMVGLQARCSPVLNHAAAMIRDGQLGTIRSAALTHSVDWLSQPFPSIAYLQDRASGAHFLSIPGGHSIDTLCWLLGSGFGTLSAHIKTSLRDLQMAGTGAPLVRTSADQILVAGELESGVIASIRLSGASSPGTGIRLEISGDKGDLVVTAAPGARGIQMSDLRLQRTTGLGEFEDLDTPEEYFGVPQALRSGPPLNVAKAWLKMADAIDRGRAASPDFAEAVEHHRLLDRIETQAGLGGVA
jgi:predicted dehydrogenase